MIPRRETCVVVRGMASAISEACLEMALKDSSCALQLIPSLNTEERPKSYSHQGGFESPTKRISHSWYFGKKNLPTRVGFLSVVLSD